MMIRNIQGLRAVAALAIVLFHAIFIEDKYGNGARVLPLKADWLEYGVDLFFVISGFIMAQILAKENTWRAFLFSRVTRIYPIYWFYTSLLLPLFFLTPGMLNSAYAHAPSLWRSYLLWPDDVGPLLAVGWTLIHEMYFYWVVTLILALRLPFLGALLGWAAVLLMALVFPYTGDSPVLVLVLHPLTLEFILGALIGYAVQRGFTAGARWALLVGGAGLLATIAAHEGAVSITSGLRIAAVGVPCGLIVYGAAVVREWNSRLLFLVGDASYSLYLSHVLVLSVLGRLFVQLHSEGMLAELAFITGSIVVAVVYGVVSYRILERPLIRRSRRMQGTR